MPLAQLSRLPSSAKTARLRPGSGNGVWVPPPNGGHQLRWASSFGVVGSAISRIVIPPSRHAGKVAADDRMVQREAPAAPARRLAACSVHAGQPPAADHLGAARLDHV